MVEQLQQSRHAQANGKARHDTQLKPKRKHRKKKISNQATDIDTPLTDIRKKIRSLEKLLAHDAEVAKASLDSKNSMGVRSMPSHIRQEKERALSGYKHDLGIVLAKNAKTKEHSKMITRYHHVRFFERKKAERVLKRAKSELENAGGSEDAVLQAQSDLFYTLYLPLSEKYVSLWPQHRGDDPDKVRDGSSWRTIQDMFIKARDEGLTKLEIEDKLLRIRDHGWMSTFGIDQLSTKAGGRAQEPSEFSHKKVKRTENRQSRSSNPSLSAQDKEDVVMDSDSDGFFEK